MIETVTLYTCDLCFRTQWINVLDSLTQNWTIIPMANPLHLCPQCGGLAQRLLSVLSIPFDFEDREHIKKTRFNIFKVRDLSVLFPKPATDENVTPTITKGWQAQLDRIRVALSAALEELDDSEGDPRPCMEYALGQVRKLGLFGGLEEKEGGEECM